MEHEPLTHDHLMALGAPYHVVTGLKGLNIGQFLALLKKLIGTGLQLWPTIEAVLQQFPGLSGNALFQKAIAWIDAWIKLHPVPVPPAQTPGT